MVTTDSPGGTAIAENDDPEAAYRNALNYAPWLSFETKTVLKVEDAVPQIADYLGG